MAVRRCEVCGASYWPRSGAQRFCGPGCRVRALGVAAGRGRYGGSHSRLRRRVAQVVAGGRVRCARCGELIVPGRDLWDLDHSDDGKGYLGASHRVCNRSTSRRPEPTPSPVLEDDPENHRYFGPPDLETGKQLEWSRIWFAWRGDPRYDPSARPGVVYPPWPEVQRRHAAGLPDLGS